MSIMRALAPLLVLLLTLVARPGDAVAGPAASGQVSTSGGNNVNTSAPRVQWPERVIGGNAVSFIAPFQVGAVGFLPKGRFSLQYDRQLSAALARHWIHVGASFLFDYGDWDNFRLDDCTPLPANDGDGSCGRGGVVGYDIYAGYAHRFFIKKYPFLVPHLKGSVGFAWWALPDVGGGAGGRYQSRYKSWTLNLRPGGGLRIFIADQIGLGMDVNIPIGFLVHTDVSSDGLQTESRSGGFLLGFEIMPLLLEFRF